MPFVSVTRLRPRNLRALAIVALHSWRSKRQLEGQPGFLGGYLATSRPKQEHCEQEGRSWRKEADALTSYVPAGEIAWAEGQQWQRPPDLAFEVQHAMNQIMDDGWKADIRFEAAP